jgi:hypothetical protein
MLDVIFTAPNYNAAVGNALNQASSIEHGSLSKKCDTYLSI